MHKLKSEVIDIRQQSQARRDALADECRTVFDSVFAALGEGDFVPLLFSEGPVENRIKIFRDQEGRVVGFLAFALFLFQVDGRRCGVIRSPMGFLPEHQGEGMASSPLAFHFGQAARCLLFHPTTLIYYMNNMIGPQAFHVFANTIWRTYPSPRFPRLPAREQAVVDAAASFFHWGPPDDGFPLTRKLPLRVTLPPAALNLRKRCVAFFVENNPHYQEGYGLPQIIPITLENFVFSSAIFAVHTARRVARHLGLTRPSKQGGRP